MATVDKVHKGIYSIGLVTACAFSSILALSLMFISTPSQLGPAGVTLWFILVFMALTSFFMISHWLYNRKRNSFLHGKRQSVGALRTAVVPAGALVVLLGMSSLGTLALSDALLICGAAIVIELFLYTNNRKAE
jgi:phosphatidylserine synthase